MNNEQIEELFEDLGHIEPETVRAIRGESTPRIQVLKDMAKKVIKGTDGPFVDFYIFENIVHILNEVEPNVDLVEGCTPEQIWYALDRMKEMLGDDFNINDEVKTYIRYIYKDNGLIFLPDHITGPENPNIDKIKKRYNEGNLDQSEDDILTNQAIALGRILHYIDNFEQKLK